MSAPRVDRYGWFQESPIEDDSEESNENEREMKWMKMLQRWDFYITNKYNLVAKRIRKGIPDAVRSKAWLVITQAE